MIKMSLAVETISYDHLFLPFFFFLKVGEDFLQSIGAVCCIDVILYFHGVKHFSLTSRWQLLPIDRLKFSKVKIPRLVG